MLAQRVRKRMAADHFRANRCHQLAQVVALGLLAQHRQRFVERQPRDQQARELARDDRLLALRQLAAERQALVTLAVQTLRGQLDDERRQALRAQLAAPRTRTVCFEHALQRAAGGIDRFVAECRHAGVLLSRVRLLSMTSRSMPDGVAGEDYGANRRKFVTDVGLAFWRVLLLGRGFFIS